ncbi:MAG: maltodextrin glucosidase [Chloroflexi bacterium]|nr:maltodextrin glucosidase [Chloroflexota bacterium]
MLPNWLQSVHHDGSAKYVSNPMPRLGETIRVRLRVGDQAPVRRVYLRTFPDGEQMFTAMYPGAHESPAQWWEAPLSIHQPIEHYRFLLQADDGMWWLTAAGPVEYEPLDMLDFRILADFQPLDWLEDAVFYQIYPERFANGDPTNDPRPEEYEYRGHRPHTYPWGTQPPENASWPLIFYGGDLQGVTQHLDHLQNLGVNAIYLNPIFEAYSVHKYDPIDYTQVDPHLGGNEALIALRQALDERGMRYLLDIVPNHCGARHPWFLAAQDDPAAHEAEFFTFIEHPDEYLSWLGHKSLVKLNYQSETLRRRIYQDDDAIFRRWLRPPFSADGWRVDVGNMLGRQGAVQMNGEVIRAIRDAVKTARPDAYLMGENFFDASAQLQGDQWDGVMNYAGLAAPLWNWLRGYETGAIGLQETIQSPVPYTTSALEATWRYRRAPIPWSVALQQYNLLGSHDTSRIRSVVHGNDALHRLAVIVQLTFPGVPALYYGDEIGMMDVPPMKAIGCMVWDQDQWDHALFNFYRDLVALRRRSSILKQGGFQMLTVETDTFAYQREATEGRVIVIAHRGSTPRPAGSLSVAHGGIPNGTRFIEHFSGYEAVVSGGVLPIPVQPQGASLWESVK